MWRETLTIRILMSLVPLWIGIIFNIGLSIFHVQAIGHDNKVLRWYFLKGGSTVIMVSVWSFLIALSIFNLIAYK